MDTPPMSARREDCEEPRLHRRVKARLLTMSRRTISMRRSRAGSGLILQPAGDDSHGSDGLPLPRLINLLKRGDVVTHSRPAEQHHRRQRHILPEVLPPAGEASGSTSAMGRAAI
jgi:hypothetical protein